MARKAVCYVTDIGFLFPSIVSLKSLVASYHPQDTAFYIFVIDVPQDVADRVARHLSHINVHVIHMNSDQFAGFDKNDVNKTHVPLATLGRFFVERLLPESIEELLYVDGDTFVCGPIAPLLDVAVPEGRLLAAEDISSFCRKDVTPFGEDTRAYFQGIGVTDDLGYFNAGVLKAHRRTWRAIEAEAYEFFISNTKLCRYHDQSALNAVVRDRRLTMSGRYNFMTAFAQMGLARSVSPALCHFAQSVKPWASSCAPWEKFYPLYQNVEQDRLALDLPLQKLSAGEAGAHRRAARLQQLKYAGPMLPRLLARRAKYKSIEAGAFLR